MKSSNDVLPMLPSIRVDSDQDWRPSDFDVRHTFSGGMSFAIPSPAAGPPWRAVASGWSIDSVFIGRSAAPVNILTGTTAFGVSNALRPDVVSGVPLYVSDATVPGGRRFNRAAFAAPPVDAGGNPLRQGTLGRSAFRGFAMSQLDLVVRRDVPLGRAMNLQLRIEVFNLVAVPWGPTHSLSCSAAIVISYFFPTSAS